MHFSFLSNSYLQNLMHHKKIQYEVVIILNLCNEFNRKITQKKNIVNVAKNELLQNKYEYALYFLK